MERNFIFPVDLVATIAKHVPLVQSAMNVTYETAIKLCKNANYPVQIHKDNDMVVFSTLDDLVRNIKVSVPLVNGCKRDGVTNDYLIEIRTATKHLKIVKKTIVQGDDGAPTEQDTVLYQSIPSPSAPEYAPEEATNEEQPTAELAVVAEVLPEPLAMVEPPVVVAEAPAARPPAAPRATHPGVVRTGFKVGNNKHGGRLVSRRDGH